MRLEGNLIIIIIIIIMTDSTGRCPGDLRCRSAVAHFRKLAGLFPAGTWISVSSACCVLSGRGLCDGPVIGPEEF